jgi:hypothetical protein
MIQITHRCSIPHSRRTDNFEQVALKKYCDRPYLISLLLFRPYIAKNCKKINWMLYWLISSLAGTRSHVTTVKFQYPECFFLCKHKILWKLQVIRVFAEYEGSMLLTNKPNHIKLSAISIRLPPSEFFQEAPPYNYYMHTYLVCPTRVAISAYHNLLTHFIPFRSPSIFPTTSLSKQPGYLC